MSGAVARLGGGDQGEVSSIRQVGLASFVGALIE